MIAGSLEIQMLANMARLQQDMNQAKGVVGGAMKNIESSVASAKTALAGLGLGIGIGAFAALIKGSIDAADHLRDLGASTDIPVGKLAGLRLLARQTGTDLDGLAKGINKMSVEMGKDPAAFKALGITAKDSIGAFKQMADLFNALPDIQQRNALAQKVFSKSWAELAPVLREGGDKIGEVIERGEKLSGITKEMADQADALNDKWAELTGTGGFLTRMVGPLLPLLNALADDMLDVQNSSAGAGKQFSFLAETLRPIIILAGNFGYTWRTIGIAAAGAWEQMAGLKNGGFAGFLKAREMVSKILEDERKSFDAWEARIMSAGTAGAGGAGAGRGMSPGANQAGDAAAAAAAKAAAARAAAFLAEKKTAEDTDSAYRGLLKSLKQKQMYDTELTAIARLQIDLDALSAKQRATITPLREKELRNMAQEIDLRANLLVVSKAYNEQNLAAEAERNRKDDIAAGFRTANRERIEDIEFETKLLEMERQANGASLLQKDDEIRLLSRLSAAREIEIGLRQISRDLDRAILALGPEITSDTQRRIGELEDLAEAQRKLLTDKVTARESARLFNDLTKNQASEFASLWSTVESTGKTVFMHVFGDGKTAFEGIGKAIKASVIDLLYQITVKKWILNIGASIAGGGSGSALAGGGGALGGLGDLGNLASGANSLLGSNTGLLGGLFSGAGAYAAAVPGLTMAGAGSQAAMLAAQTGVFGAEGLALTASAGGSALAGGAAAGLAAVPVAGWIALAAIAAYSLMSKDKGPKTGDIQLIRQDVQNWMDTSATSTGRSFVVGNNNLSGNQTENEKLLWSLIPILNDATKYDPAALDKLVGTTISGSDVNQDIQQLLAAIEPAAKAAAALTQTEQDRIAAINKAIGLLRESYQTEVASLEAMAAKWHAAADGLRAYGATLIGLGSGGISYATAARQFAIVSAQARAGDMGAMGSLQGVSETFRTASLSSSPSALAYARDVARIQAAVNDSISVADSRESIALQQRDLLTTQVESLIDINDSVVTVADAIGILQGQIADLKATAEATGKKTAEATLILQAAANGSLSLHTTEG